MLNIGLLTPQQIIDGVIAKSAEVPLNSLEGFVRQVIGWREFVRLVYLHAGSRQRTTNAWSLSRTLPASFYTGSTGIVPFDQSIKRILKYAYCHHIERLMVLGNFMLLCDIDTRRGLSMVHGDVHRFLRLGDGSQRLWYEPTCGRRTDDNQALHQRFELHS